MSDQLQDSVAAPPESAAAATQAPEAAPEASAPATEPTFGPGTETNPILALVIEALKNVYDPEIPVNIYELGLIYGLDITPDGSVLVRMTLTTPSCPVAGSLPGEVEGVIRSIAGVTDCEVELVWDPPWTPEKLSEAAKLELGLL
jgi:FeS assembly SUF system protein